MALRKDLLGKDKGEWASEDLNRRASQRGGVRASKLILEEPMMIAGTEILAQGVTILDGDLKYDNRWLSLQVLRLLQLNRAKHSLGMSRISICFLSS